MIISLFSSGGGGTYDVKLGVALPTVDDTGLVYDGTVKSPTIGSYSTDLMTVTVTPQTNAGTYQVHCSLKDKTKYAWLNTIDSADQDIPWTIERAVGTLTLSANSIEVGEDGTETVTVTPSESTTIHAVSNDTDVATVSVSGTTLSVSDGGSEGTATITISADDSTNYTYDSVTLAVETVYLQIVTWAEGTDAQIAKMCAASDEGRLNLYDYWNVGDKRTVSLSAMAATGVGESHRAQNVVMVIVNKGGYGTTSGLISAFIVQQESCLASTDSGTTSDSERGYMNSSNTNSGSWNGCARRTWCNNIYRNAIPSTLRSIFKQVNVKTIETYDGSTIQTSNDYFFLPAAAEVFKGDVTYGTGGTAGQYTAYSNLTEFNALTRWKYYETIGNRIKKIGLSGAAYYWWERSPRYDDALSFCRVYNYGSADRGGASVIHGLAPAGCIGTANNGSGVVIPSWSDGTDAQIVAAVNAADAGKVDLTDYWNVGDKRTVSLSAMAATYVSELHRAQDVVLILCDKNNQNYPYVTATSGRTYCNFVVQQENCLSSTDSGTGSDSERGYMNSSNTNNGSWNSCKRRKWCNNVYRNAIPSSLRNIFKQVKVTTAQTYNGSTNQQSDDYFFLPAAAEVFKGDSQYGTGGTAGQYTAYSNLTEFNALSRWQYYETTGNRVKKMGASGSAHFWWERSPGYNDARAFCYVGYSGYADTDMAMDTIGLSPCGCI